MREKFTRRQFAAGALTSAAALAACRRNRSSSYDFLSDSHSRTLAVLCDQIIPADDFPSASQAGAVVYIDRQLARHYRRHQKTYLAGLDQAETIARTRFGRVLADCTPVQQFEIVSALEKDNRSFFALLRAHTMEGYYGNPRHGGNRDAVSWRMLGLAEPPLRGRPQYDLRKGSQA